MSAAGQAIGGVGFEVIVSLLAQKANGCGIAALGIWAFSALLILQLGHVPVFQILTWTLGISGVITMLRLTFMGTWRAVFQCPPLWVASLLGIFGNDWAYFQALKYAPAAHVELISYLWPLGALGVGALFVQRIEMQASRWLGLCLALLGVAVLLLHDQRHWVMAWDHLRGYVYALLGVVFWGGYAVVAAKYRQAPIEIIGLCSGVAALMAWGIHVEAETTVRLSQVDGWVILAIGALGQCLAYLLWDYGIKNGDFSKLCAFSYVTPLVSVTLLIVFGYATPSWALGVALILVVGGILIAEDQLGALNAWIRGRNQHAIEQNIPGLRRE